MKLVTIRCNGKTETHLPHHNGNYATLCGMDGDDDHYIVSQSTISTPKGAKVNCKDCFDVWDLAHQFHKNIFASELQHGDS